MVAYPLLTCENALLLYTLDKYFPILFGLVYRTPVSEILAIFYPPIESSVTSHICLT